MSNADGHLYVMTYGKKCVHSVVNIINIFVLPVFNRCCLSVNNIVIITLILLLRFLKTLLCLILIHYVKYWIFIKKICIFEREPLRVTMFLAAKKATWFIVGSHCRQCVDKHSASFVLLGVVGSDSFAINVFIMVGNSTSKLIMT